MQKYKNKLKMTGYEALKLCSGQMDMLRTLGVNPNDCRYLKLYEDYNMMRQKPDKVSYIVATLAERYKVSERTVYDMVKRLRRSCKLIAV